MITWIIIGVVVAIVLFIVVGGYNRLVALDQRADQSFADIDVQLKQRQDLIPNLVETVKGYATHERGTLDAVTQARAAAAGAHNINERVQAENMLTGALGRLFAVAENYPVLRASENFSQLQTELATTEDRIAAGRRFYNANVRALNTKVESFPANVIAGMFSFTRAEYFEVTDPEVRQAPQVDFGA